MSHIHRTVLQEFNVALIVHCIQPFWHGQTGSTAMFTDQSAMVLGKVQQFHIEKFRHVHYSRCQKFAHSLEYILYTFQTDSGSHTIVSSLDIQTLQAANFLQAHLSCVDGFNGLCKKKSCRISGEQGDHKLQLINPSQNKLFRVCTECSEVYAVAESCWKCPQTFSLCLSCLKNFCSICLTYLLQLNVSE
jgi:hypothetical protein